MNDAERTHVVNSLRALTGRTAYVEWVPQQIPGERTAWGEEGWKGYLGGPDTPGTFLTSGHDDPDEALLALLEAASDPHNRKYLTPEDVVRMSGA